MTSHRTFRSRRSTGSALTRSRSRTWGNGYITPNVRVQSAAVAAAQPALSCAPLPEGADNTTHAWGFLFGVHSSHQTAQTVQASEDKRRQPRAHRRRSHVHWRLSWEAAMPQVPLIGAVTDQVVDVLPERSRTVQVKRRRTRTVGDAAGVGVKRGALQGVPARQRVVRRPLPAAHAAALSLCVALLRRPQRTENAADSVKKARRCWSGFFRVVQRKLPPLRPLWRVQINLFLLCSSAANRRCCRVIGRRSAATITPITLHSVCYRASGLCSGRCSMWILVGAGKDCFWLKPGWQPHPKHPTLPGGVFTINPFLLKAFGPRPRTLNGESFANWRGSGAPMALADSSPAPPLGPCLEGHTRAITPHE